MKQPALRFGSGDELGQVAEVDTTKASIRVTSPELVTRIGVGNVAAIQGATEREYLIGIIDRVTRRIGENLLDDDQGGEYAGELVESTDDLIRVVLIGTYRTIEGNQPNTFKRGADSFPQIDRYCYCIQADNLQRFMDLLGADFTEEERLELGHYVSDPSAVAVANGDRFFQRHASILGSTGSGKSWTVALLIERAARLRYSNIIVFDLHGEYAPLTEGENAIADGLRIAGPGDLESPPDSALFLPYWLLGREEMLSMLLDRSDQNAPNQASRFTTHVRELKDDMLKKNGKEDVRKTFTVDSPIPYTLNDLIARIDDDNNRKGKGANGQPVKGEWEGKLTRFLSRLRAKLEDRRYGFLFQPPVTSREYNWLHSQVTRLLEASDTRSGIKIIDFSEVPSDVIPIVTSVLARLMYNVQFWMPASERTPFSLICDEAHLYLPRNEEADAVEQEALAVFERIAKEGRKYGVGLVVVSQRPSDVSRTIISQCNNFLVLRLTNDRDQAVVRTLVPESMGALIDFVPLLDTGECILLGDAVLLPTRVRLSSPNVKPTSATRDFWREWTYNAASEQAIKKGIESMRRQKRF